MADPAQESREAIEKNWDSLTNAFEGKQLTETQPEKKPEEEVKPPEGEKSEDFKVDETAKPEVVTPEQEAETLKAEAKELGLAETASKEEVATAKADKLKIEAKELGLDETATADEVAAAKDLLAKPSIEFKVEDIKGAVEPEEGSWAAVAKEEGLTIDKPLSEYSYEDFKADLIAPYKKEAEDAKTLSKESLFSTLDPKIATVLKLIDMGVPPEQALNPTQRLDNYLAMESAALVRADLEGQGLKPETVDAEIELLTSTGKLEHRAEMIKHYVGQQKELAIKQTEEYISQYEAKKEQAILHQKEQDQAHFQKTMNTVSTFMGTTLPADVKEAVIRKYNNGAYDKDLTSPESKVEYILYREFKDKILSKVKSDAHAAGREEIRRKLVTAPPKTESSVGAVQKLNQNNEQDNWAAIDKMAAQLK